MKTLIDFRHGLGDAIQLTTVLLHLQKHRPNWVVDVSTLIGKHSAFQGLCHKVFAEGRESPCCQYQQRFDLGWHECHTAYADSPSTKAERCLREDFGITPDPALCRYSIQCGDEAMTLARNYLERVCNAGPGPDGRYPAVLIHYEGNTSAEFKNIPTEIIRRLCDDILEAGFTPIILDWDYRTPLVNPQPDGTPSRIHCPNVTEPLWRGTGTGDAESLATLIELSTLMIGVDSGPLHVAGATSTPTLGVWTHHHPLHYCGHADNVTHLVPVDHAQRIRGVRSIGESYFTSHYQFQTYRYLEDALRVAVRARLGRSEEAQGLIFTRGFWIRDDNGEQDLVVVQDVAEEDSYRIDEISLLNPGTDTRGNDGIDVRANGHVRVEDPNGTSRTTPTPVVVDVGGHIGCFSKRLHQRNPQARILALECCPENIPVLEKNIGDFATVIQAAVTYEPDVALLNAVYANCRSTGGSTLINREQLQDRVVASQICLEPCKEMPSEYWADFRAIRTVTLEDLMHEHGFDRIDVLKLDCEGSEFSILGKTTSLERIGLIVGEYHGKANFERLVAERFGDWELTILREGDLGTFWLSNPNYQMGPRNGKAADRIGSADHLSPSNGNPQRNGTIHGPHSFPLSPVDDLTSRQEFRERLMAAFHPSDRINFEAWIPSYQSLFELSREWNAHRIVEIGVRAGYSALTMLQANPEAMLIGIEADGDETIVDTHGGRKGLWRHAREILNTFDFHLLLVDSHVIRQLPSADVIYVDGDHSYRGCLSDLRLAEASTDRILVDDYDSIPSVRQACDTFTTEHPEFRRRYIDNKLTGFLLFERSP